MATFKDNTGKDWVLALDAPTIRAVRTECDGLDLAATDGGACEKLADDPCLLVDVLWVLCREQSSGIASAEFGKRLVGDTIESATSALLECIADFFPKRKRELSIALAAKNKEIRELAMDKALAKVNDPATATRLVAAYERQMDAAFETMLTQLSSATNSPDSVESAHEA